MYEFIIREDAGRRGRNFYRAEVMQSGPVAALPEALAHLNAHLEDDRNSNEETLTIAASLLEASPNDTATVHKTLSVVGRQPELHCSPSQRILASLPGVLGHYFSARQTVWR
ncbi:MAG: hypothetical protein ACXVIO_03725, partial [Candidatus Angelobacter sp.]